MSRMLTSDCFLAIRQTPQQLHGLYWAAEWKKSDGHQWQWS
jgi:hypothetical protein